MATCTLLVAAIVALFVYLLGVVKHLTKVEEHTCQMTYMFEYPQYVWIELPDDVYERYPRYGLYAYGEGFVIGKIRAMHFSGIPVLFVPGNAGSYQQGSSERGITKVSHWASERVYNVKIMRQVENTNNYSGVALPCASAPLNTQLQQIRSMASISLRKSIKDRTPFHFDFFTADLNGEYSALHGGMLNEQTEFLTHCIQRILKLYAGQIESVILVGHSMGGIIAKGVLLEPNMNFNQVNTIITLAAPHRPALVLDNLIAEFYGKLQKSQKLFNESDIISLSVGGGPKDIVINSQQTIDPVADINVLLTSIPGVWQSTDHLAILWCKEFVTTIIRILFDSVDTARRPPQIISDKERRLAVLNYHLSHRSGGKKMSKYQVSTEFGRGGEWIEDIRRQYVWTPANRTSGIKNKPIYLMIRLIGREDHVTIQTVNLEVASWLFTCTASSIQDQSRICEWGWNLTNQTRKFPDDARSKKKIVDLDVTNLKALKLSHVIIRLPSTVNDKRLSIGVDLHVRSDRTIKFAKSRIPFYWIFGKLGTIQSNVGQIRYDVDVGDVISAVRINLKSIKCNQAGYDHQATIELLEPWHNGTSQFRFFSLGNITPKTIQIQTKNDLVEPQSVTPILRFTLDPQCSYEFEVWHGGMLEYLSSHVRDKWQTLYGTTVALSMLAMAKQVDGDNGFISSNYITVITIALCFWFCIGLESFVSLAFLYLFAVCLCCAVIFFGSTIYSIAHRFLARAFRFPVSWSSWIFGGLNQLPLLTTTIIMSMIPVTCSALAMFLSLALNFLRLINCYEDCLEKFLLSSLRIGFLDKMFKKREKKPDSQGKESKSNGNTDIEQMRFQLVYFIVCCIAAVPAIPSVLTWAKNYRYGIRLTTEDPYLTFCWMTLVGCDSISARWISPNTSGYYSREIATVVRLLGWAALVITGGGYPCQYQYLMPLLMTVAAFLVSIRPIIGFTAE